MVFALHLCLINVTDDMSSSSVISTSDSSSSNEGTSAHTQAEVSHSPRGPPRQLCQCTKCVGQISQKSYVCAQHIQRFGRHRGLTPGASSSHVVSVILPLSFFLFDTCYFSWNPLWNYFHFHGLLWFFECNRVPVWHHHPMFYHKGF